MSTVTLPLALENTSQQLLLESGLTTLSVVAPETGGGTQTSLQIAATLTISAKASGHLGAVLAIARKATDSLSPSLTIKATANGHLAASLTISNPTVTMHLAPHLAIKLYVTQHLAPDLTIVAKGHPTLGAVLDIFTAIVQPHLAASLTVRAKATPKLGAALTIYHPHTTLPARLTVRAKKTPTIPAHLSISFTGLVLIPPDASLPYNETQVYKIRYMHPDGSVTIPTGTFTTSAGTMDPPGVTSSGEATLIPDKKLGVYYVAFVESE